MAVEKLNLANGTTLTIPEWAEKTNEIIESLNIVSSNTSLNSFIIGLSEHTEATFAQNTYVNSVMSNIDSTYATNTYVNSIKAIYSTNTYVNLIKSDIEETYATNTYVNTTTSAANILIKIKTVDGASSGLDSDLLDGQHGSYYLTRTNQTGVIPDSGLPDRIKATAKVITDWNDAVEPGFYTSDNSSLNAPTANYLFGIVTDRISGTYVCQDVIEITSNVNDTKSWRRHKVTGTWGSWYRLRLSETEQQTLWDTRYPLKTISVSAGNGMSGGGNLSANRTLTLGTPGTISGSSTNDVTSTSHTHALTLASADITGALGFTPVSTTGNAATASKWQTARSFTLVGDATGTTSFDGSGNISVTVDVNDSSKLGGKSSNLLPNPNTIVLRDGSGNLHANNIHTTVGGPFYIATPTAFFMESNNDGYLKRGNVASITNAIKPTLDAYYQAIDSNIAKVNSIQQWLAPQYSWIWTMTPSDSITLDLFDSNDFAVTFSHSGSGLVTFNNPTNTQYSVNQKGTIIGTQGSNGSAIAFGNYWHPIGSSTVPEISLESGSRFRIDYHVTATNYIDYSISSVGVDV